MPDDVILIASYTKSDRSELLRLLLELQSTYFQQNAPKQLQELKKEKDIKQSYSDYIASIEQDKDGLWQIWLAKTGDDKTIGFIIGSIETDEYQVLGKIGNFEDWYVEPFYRGQGIGLKLYDALEKWFKGNGCRQVQSDTWEGNELSIKAHKLAGFFVSGIQFSKKL